MWTAVHARLNPSVELVAVAYADSVNATCIDVEEVLKTARQFGFKRVLIDTFTKDGRSTVDHLGATRLAAISRWATHHKIWWALAGSIKLASISDLSRQGIFPNCFGVRGDVCPDHRTGTICEQRVQNWDAAMAAMSRFLP